jgi:isochorismate hydrolase
MRDLSVFYVADGTASVNRALHVAALQSVAGWVGHVVPARTVISRLSA